MNTSLTRLNALFAFTVTVLAALTVICSLSTAFKDYSKLMNIELSTDRVLVKNVPDYSAGRDPQDLGFVTFNLKGDFAPVFDWNTKQIFMYLTAHYKTEDNIKNQVVLWDHIIERGQQTKLNMRGANTKYYFFDDGKGLKGNQNVTLTLSMNVIPNAGFLPMMSAAHTYKFNFPNEYTKKA